MRIAPSELSESQKACLRRVAKGMSSKEIAKDTGLAPMTVDTYVKQAMAALGASNRREAARILASWDESQKSGSPPPEVAAPAKTPAEPAVREGAWPRWPTLPPVGGGTHSLGWREKLFGVLQVATVSLIVVVGLTLLIAGALRLLR